MIEQTFDCRSDDEILGIFTAAKVRDRVEMLAFLVQTKPQTALRLVVSVSNLKERHDLVCTASLNGASVLQLAKPSDLRELVSLLTIDATNAERIALFVSNVAYEVDEKLSQGHDAAVEFVRQLCFHCDATGVVKAMESLVDTHLFNSPLAMSQSNVFMRAVSRIQNDDNRSVGRPWYDTVLSFKRLYKDQTAKQMKDLFRRFCVALQENSKATGLFYFSGHGMIENGTPFILPCDSNDRDDCLGLPDIVNGMCAGRDDSFNIIILDCCRSVGKDNEEDRRIEYIATAATVHIIYACSPNDSTFGGLTPALATNCRHCAEFRDIVRLTTLQCEMQSLDKRVWCESSGSGSFWLKPGIPASHTLAGAANELGFFDPSRQSSAPTSGAMSLASTAMPTSNDRNAKSNATSSASTSMVPSTHRNRDRNPSSSAMSSASGTAARRHEEAKTTNTLLLSARQRGAPASVQVVPVHETDERSRRCTNC
jgi:hypothetical protein